MPAGDASAAAMAGETGSSSSDPDFPDHEECVRRAALLSKMVYMNSKNLKNELLLDYRRTMPFRFVHTGGRTGDLHPAGQKIICAMDCNQGDRATVYICFRGTQGIPDLITDAIAQHGELRDEDDLGPFDGAVKGDYHWGFCNRVKHHVPKMRALRRFLDNYPDTCASKRLVFCGHSLGGAVAHITLIKYLLSSQGRAGGGARKSIAIAFGAPHICDSNARDYLMQKSWEDKLFNYVAEDDPIPYFLNNLPVSIRASQDILKKWTEAAIKATATSLAHMFIPSKSGGIVEECITWFVHSGFDLGSLLFQQVDGSDDTLLGYAAENLTKMLAYFVKQKAKEQPETSWYVPIGVFRSAADHALILPSDREKALSSVTEKHLRAHRMAVYFDSLVVMGKDSSTCAPSNAVLGLHVMPGNPPQLTSARLAISSNNSDSRRQGILWVDVEGSFLDPLLRAFVELEGEQIPLGVPCPAHSSNGTVAAPDSQCQLRFEVEDEQHKERLLRDRDQPAKLHLVTWFGQTQWDIHRDISSVTCWSPNNKVKGLDFGNQIALRVHKLHCNVHPDGLVSYSQSPRGERVQDVYHVVTAGIGTSQKKCVILVFDKVEDVPRAFKSWPDPVLVEEFEEKVLFPMTAFEFYRAKNRKLDVGRTFYLYYVKRPGSEVGRKEAWHNLLDCITAIKDTTTDWEQVVLEAVGNDVRTP